MSVVIDTSISLSWYFSDEGDAFTDSVLDKVVEARGVAPALWATEMANGFVMAVRRNRMTQKERSEAISDLQDLPIDLEDIEPQVLWADTIQLADTHGLSVYDATYLETASRLKLPLATADKALKRAALDAGIKLFGQTA